MFKYFGFGINIKSEVSLPELIPADFDTPDLEISYGLAPKHLKSEPIVRRAFSLINKDEYLFEVRFVGKFYAREGNFILVEPFDGSDDKSIRLFLLGSVFAAIIYQRGWIPLHASAICKSEKLTIFAGNSGAGKSSLAASLSLRGYQLFTDDICILKKENNSKVAITGSATYPMLKLWEDTIVNLNSDKFISENKIRPHLPKYGQFFFESYQTKQVLVDKIFILETSYSSSNVSIEKLSMIDAFKHLERMAYRPHFIYAVELRETYFTMLSALCSTITVWKVGRPREGSDINILSDLIENYI